LEHCGADDPFVRDRYHHGLAVNIDSVKPHLDLVAIDEVLLQKGAILLRHALEKLADFAAILRD